MSRRLVTRVLYAPLVIAITTTVVPPASLELHVNKFATKTMPAALASVDTAFIADVFNQQVIAYGEGVGQVRASLDTRILESAVHVVGAREAIAVRFSAATDFLSSRTEASLGRFDATLAKIDSWMTSMSLSVIAALPGGLTEASANVVAERPAQLAEVPPPVRTASVHLVGLAPLPALPERKDAPGNTAPELTGSAAPALEPAAVAPERAAAPQRRIQLAQVAIEEVTSPAPAPVAAKPPVLASVAVTSADAVPTVAPQAPEVMATRESKQVVASLGPQAATAFDVLPTATEKPKAIEARLAPEPEAPADDDFEDRHIENGGADMPPATDALPMSSPLKLRPLTRADIPSAEKFASLNSAVESDALVVPAEQQRVAFDEPIFAELPISVGKRKWIDETKYKGLGRPEALLEALRHLGANAKALGLPPSLWCADFMNLVLRKTGIKATGSRAARSYLEYGQKIDEPRVGAIAVLSRGKNNGHIGIVRGTDGNGNPIIISGNHGNRVAEAVYPKHRVLAYVVPK